MKYRKLLLPAITLLFGIILLVSPVAFHAFAATNNLQAIKTVFIIVMENHNWSSVKSAPYITSLITQGAHAEQYFNPPGLHPSEPNYIWLEGGSNFGITDDSDPTSHSIASSAHLVTFLNNAGIPWKAYQEDIPGTNCPLHGVSGFAPKHLGALFFNDVTGTNNPSSSYCIAHIRPYTELSTDLINNTTAKYNFITPNLCDDMHDCSVATGDTWLKNEVPKILNSAAYKNNGAIFITWDEGGSGSDGPIGMIVLSPLAKVNYQNSIHYTHSSTLRTMQNIFGVNTTYLADAANATDLTDLFSLSTSITPTSTPTPTPVPPTATPTPIPQPSSTPTCQQIPTTDLGTATATLSITSAGNYTVWSRIQAPDSTNNSYLLQIDSLCPIRIGDSASLPTNTWSWVNYFDGLTAQKIQINLTSGTHIIKFIGSEPNVKLDKAFFTQDMTCTPDTLGNTCTSSITPTATSTTAPAPSNTPNPTLTPTPTLKPTNPPTPTLVPNTTSLQLTVFLHGIGKAGDNQNPGSGGNMTPVRTSRVMSVSLYDPNAALAASKVVTLQFNSTTGSFNGTLDLGTTFQSNTYTIKVKADSYRSSQVPGFATITQGKSTVINPVYVVAGDINGDNALSILDYNVLIDCYSDLAPALHCTAANKLLGDLNDDGAVNQYDYNLFLREWFTANGN